MRTKYHNMNIAYPPVQFTQNTDGTATCNWCGIVVPLNALQHDCDKHLIVVPAGETDVQDKAQDKVKAPCKFRGEPIRLVICQSCASKPRIKTFACELFQECTIGKEVAPLACCATCKKYEPKV
jgi:hypothetical protein